MSSTDEQMSSADDTWRIIVGWTGIVLGLITFTCSTISLVKMVGRKSVRFLRIILIIITICSAMSIGNGAIELYFYKEEK